MGNLLSSRLTIFLIAVILGSIICTSLNVEQYIDRLHPMRFCNSIVYSKKIGYVWIVVDEPGAAGAELLDTPEAMLDNLFNDIINDVVAPRESTSLTEAHALTESEEAECRRRIAAILRTIEGGADEYLNYLDSYLKDYQERYHEDGE